MKSLRVLVADDNPINQRMVVAMLKSLGHTGVVVGDGEKAVRCLEQLKFDMALLDVMMPNLDGLGALALIRERQLGGQPHLPVVMVTAHDMPGDRERFLAAGADGYLAKPVDTKGMQAEFERLLGR